MTLPRQPHRGCPTGDGCRGFEVRVRTRVPTRPRTARRAVRTDHSKIILSGRGEVPGEESTGGDGPDVSDAWALSGKVGDDRDARRGGGEANRAGGGKLSEKPSPRVGGEKDAGGIRSANADMSSDNAGVS